MVTIIDLLNFEDLHPRIQRWGKMVFVPEYRKCEQEKKRSRHIPRCTIVSTSMLGSSVELVDCESFIFTYHSIFEQEIYRFKMVQEQPLIIDGAANIGFQTLHGVLSILHQAVFRVHIHSCYASSQPLFVREENVMGMDLRLNIFGYQI
jgi:hypothetical protein